MPMMMVAPLFLEDGKFTSRVSLVNASSEVTYATVFVRSLGGETLLQKRVLLGPNSTAHIALRELLDEAKSSETRGSIIVEQSPDLNGMAVLAQLSITHQSAHTSYLDEELAMPDPTMDSPILRAVGRGKEKSVLVAISSLSQYSQEIRTDCLSSNAETTSATVTLAPNSTVLIDACKRGTRTSVTSFANQGVNADEFVDDGEAGQSGTEAVGIQLVSNAGPGQFAAFGISRRRATGDVVLAALPFSDPKLAASSSTVFAGVPTGYADLLAGGSYKPYVAVANFSLHPAHVTVQFSSTSGATGATSTSKVIASEILVQAREATTVSLADLQGDPGLRNSFIVSSDAAPGDVAVSMASNAGDGEGEVELLGKDSAQSENMGAHPWSIAGGNESTLLLFNHTDQKQNTVVTVFSNKSLRRERMKLGPFETIALSISDVIRNNISDDQREILGTDPVEGEIQWTMGQDKTITGRLLVSNKIASMARNFSCQSYNVLCSNTITPASTTVHVGANTGFSLTPSSCIAYTIGACTGSPGGSVSPLFEWNWGGGLNASCGNSYSCTLTATAAGSTTVTGTAYTTWCNKPATASVTVKPTISGGNTVWWFNGQTVSGYSTQITLTTQSSGTWNVTAGATKVHISSSTGQSINVTGTGTFSQSSGDVKITVTVNGVASDTFSLSSNGPAFLSRSSKSDFPCSGNGEQGWDSFINYTLRDNFNNPMPNVPVNEAFSGSTVWPRVTSTGGTTTGTGTFTDDIFVCAAPGGLSPMPISPQQPETNTLVDSFHQNWCSGSSASNSWGSACVGGQTQSGTLQRFIDHGQVTVP
jgi:hypothetical protein